MAQTPLPPPDPSGRVGSNTRSADEQALLEARLARLAARRAAHPSQGGAPSGGGQPARTPPGRRHPAARARMAAVGLSVASTAGLVALFASGKSAGAGSESAGSAAIVRTGSAVGATGTLAPTTTSAPATTSSQSASQATIAPATAAPATAAPATQATAASTVVDGAVSSNRWGNVQVEATFDAAGNLTDVVALQTPNDRGRSIEINNYAVPELASEALSAQSASIDSISGATYTSNSYAQSLQSAIDAARAAGVTNIA